MVPKVVDFSIEYGEKIPDKNSMSSIMKIYTSLLLDIGQKVTVDYIKLNTYLYKKLVQGELKTKALEILNEIYNEHNKLTLLGLGYPIYTISTNHTEKGLELCCVISDFSKDNNIGNYKVKKFVDIIWVENRRISELTFSHPINLNSSDGVPNIKLNGVEYIRAITDANIDVVNYSIKNKPDKTLVLNNANIFSLINKEVHGIEKIKFNNTCIIEDISFSIFSSIKTLKEIQLCKSIKTIEGGIELMRALRQDNEGYFIDVDEPSVKEPVEYWHRIVRVTFTED